MADIKQIEIIPTSGPLGTKLFIFGDFPGGLSVSTDHIRPKHPKRTQNGSLITQQLLYNKKRLSVSGMIYDILFHIYLRDLFESGITATLKLWYEDASYTEQTNFNALVQFISYRDIEDENGNTRSVSMIFEEI
jgi:hypothetical protein